MDDYNWDIGTGGFSFGDFNPQLEWDNYDQFGNRPVGLGDSSNPFSFPSFESLMKIGGGALSAFALLQQALGPGQNRQPRLDRGGFAPTPVGSSAPSDPQTAQALAGRMQQQGVPLGAVSLDFYRNALPDDFASLPPELLLMLLKGQSPWPGMTN